MFCCGLWTAAALPQDREAERIRVETAQRVSGEVGKNWDSDGTMDPRTRNLLGYAGVECRIIGTFYLEDDPDDVESPLRVKFGSDISNYYPNRGLKVYKPNAKALEAIVNHIDPKNLEEHIQKYGSSAKVKLGYVRYASTNRKYQAVDDVPVHIYPADLLSQKTALFGMTRTGKSNTTKIIAKSVFELRNPKNGDDKPLRIGQIIFDPNGEYANENVQDNDNALKNIWQTIPGLNQVDEVVTYGVNTHPNDPNRKRMLLNFYETQSLQVGKEIIDNLMAEDTSTYMKNFLQLSFETPDLNDRSALTRFNRRVLAYRAVLKRAGFTPPADIQPSTRNLFNQNLLQSLQPQNNPNSDNAVEYQSAANILSNPNPNWDQIADAFESLDKFMRDPKSDYRNFETAYVTRPNGSGERWADEDLKKIIGLFQYANGTRKIGKAVDQHTISVSSDYADDIYSDLKKGKLVIVDQSSGDPLLNKSSAKRIMTKIFAENQRVFTKGGIPPETLVYLEEAHTLLPAGSDLDLNDIWVRTAKEGSKYRIGMVYATQEVSSIQRNILKNTANWFISHLNNTDETKELCKYYDFVDFEPSIRRAQDKGFLRVKTLSNLFVIPIQVDKFEI